MRVLVCGGRDLNPNKVCAWLCTNARSVVGSEPSFVIQGGAQGADQGALYWRNIRHLQGKTFTADWGHHGNAAGPIRNAQMLSEGKPDVVIAFPGGAGTADMVAKATRAGVKVIEACGDFARAAG